MKQVPRWAGPLYLALGVATIGWVVVLANDYAATPRRCPDPAVRCGAFLQMSLRRYNLSWVVFDIALALMLLVTGWLALRRRDHVQLPAAVTSALLFVDAWFDIMSTGKSGRTIALLEAVFVELPLAALCIWIAVRAERVRRGRLEEALIRLAELERESTAEG
jgi:hypothetical protein